MLIQMRRCPVPSSRGSGPVRSQIANAMRRHTLHLVRIPAHFRAHQLRLELIPIQLAHAPTAPTRASTSSCTPYLLPRNAPPSFRGRSINCRRGGICCGGWWRYGCPSRFGGRSACGCISAGIASASAAGSCSCSWAWAFCGALALARTRCSSSRTAALKDGSEIFLLCVCVCVCVCVTGTSEGFYAAEQSNWRWLQHCEQRY